MKESIFKLALTGLALGALASWANPAAAFEGNTPYLPGISTGVPAGALPPPGFYGSDDNVIITGPLHDANNNSVAGNVNAYLNIPSVLWVPNVKILGAQYAVAVVQPYAMQSLTFPGGSTTASGLFNTIISPLNLSWTLNPNLFAKVGLGIYLPDGAIDHGFDPAAGRKVATASNIANDFWTFEPDMAISYLANGLDLTAHAIFDINTKDNDTNYQSGTLFFLDLTATKTFGKWTAGAVGNFTQQIEADQIGGVNVANSEIQHVLAGPYIGYDFGPVSISAKYLFGIRAENTFNASFFHLALSAPF